MADRTEVTITIELIKPPAGVSFGLQRRKDELVDVVRSTGCDIVFTLPVSIVNSTDGLDFRGPFVQGPKGARFIYINSGKRAGDANTYWDRRAKIHLSGIGDELIEKLLEMGDA